MKKPVDLPAYQLGSSRQLVVVAYAIAALVLIIGNMLLS